MKRALLNLLLWFWLATVSLSAAAADNVVLITFDGLRWQEVFAGIDRELAEHEDYSIRQNELMDRFWRDSGGERARRLLPFLHGTVFANGTVVGNRNANSCAAVNNAWYFPTRATRKFSPVW